MQYGRGVPQSHARIQFNWLNMKAHFDLEVTPRQSIQEIEREIKPREAA